MRLRIPNAPAGEWRGLERVAFAVFGVGLALVVVGLFSLKMRHPTPPAPVPASAAAPAKGPPLAPVKAAAIQPPVPQPAEPQPAAEKPRPPAGEPKQQHGLELRSQGSMILLARDEATALEMRQAPGHVSEMVAEGRAFSAPNHTGVFIEEVRGKLMRVRILRDSLKGRVGWVRADQVARW